MEAAQKSCHSVLNNWPVSMDKLEHPAFLMPTRIFVKKCYHDVYPVLIQREEVLKMRVGV